MRDLDDYQRKYKQEPCEEYQVKFRRKKVISLINKYQHNIILEIGCGLEPLFFQFKDFEKMVVVEPGREFYENAVNMSQREKKNIVCINEIFENSIDFIKKMNMTFDYVVCSSLLHELEAPQKFLEILYMICGKDTVIHINVPNANSIHRLLAVEMGIIYDKYQLSDTQINMQCNHTYDYKKLHSILSECGFDIIESGTYFPKFLSAMQMKRMLDEKIITEDLFDGLDKMIKYFPEYGSELYVQVKARKK